MRQIDAHGVAADRLCSHGHRVTRAAFDLDPEPDAEEWEYLAWAADPDSDPSLYAADGFGAWWPTVAEGPQTRRRASSRKAPAPLDPNRRVFTLSEVAEHFGVTPKTLVNVFVHERGLRAMHLGREWRFRAEDLQAFEQEQFVSHGRRSA